MLLAAVLLFAACSSSDPVEPKEAEEKELKPISFASGMQEEQAVTRATRAGLETVLDNKTFQVWGYKNDDYSAPNYTSYQVVIPGYTVNYDTNTNSWEYVGVGTNQDIKYWDFAAKAYRFFGYALGNSTADPATSPATVNVVGGSSSDEVTFSATVDASSTATITAAPYFSRLWFSNGNAAVYPGKLYGQPVQLQFLKPFARVRFLFTFIEGLSFGREALKNISFCPADDGNSTNAPTIATAGTVTVSYPLTGSTTVESWSSTPGTNPGDYIDKFLIDYYETPDPASIPSGMPANALPTTWPNTPGHWYTVLPTDTQGNYIVSVSAITDEIKTAIVPAEYMRWKAGYEYTYKFKISESGAITIDVIQVAINNWKDGGSSTHIIYNW